MLLPLVDLDGQCPGSHSSAHVADTEVLELESLFALDMQSPRTVRTCILQEPLAHARLVSTPVVVKDCRASKNPLGFLATQEGPPAMVLFSGDIAPFSTPKSFLALVPKNEEVFSAKNLMFCHFNTQMVLFRYHFFLFEVFRVENRGHHNNPWDSFS